MTEKGKHIPASTPGLPGFSVDGREGLNEFVLLIEKKLATLDLSQDFQRNPGLERFFRIHALKGFEAAVETMLGAGPSGYSQAALELVERYAGEVLLSTFTTQEVERFLPYNDVVVCPEGKMFAVSFSRLQTESINGRRYRCSRRKPTVAIDGVERIVLFTNEAIRRICERIVPDYHKYMKLGTAHSFFADCIHYEPTCVRPEGENSGKEFSQPAIGLFQQCFLHKYHPDILYPEIEICMSVARKDSTLLSNTLDHPCYFRVGYCPVQLESNFAIATTFLRVGFKKTKEYSLLESSTQLRGEERKKLIAEATSDDDRSAFDSGESDLRLWFHQNGIPQILALDHPVFAGERVGGMRSSPYMRNRDNRD